MLIDCQIERATKKKRTGKLHPFPTDLSAPYLTRTHGLLSIFEGTDGSSSTPPSAVNTPVMSTARMTLRERKKQVKEDDEMITPPPTISRRAKARPILNVPAASPKIGEGVAGSREIKLERLESTADSTPTAERAKKVQLKEVTPERQLRSSPGIKIHPSNSKASQTNSGAALEPPVAAATQLTSPRDTAQDAQSHASVHLNTITPVGETPRLGASSNASAPKIMLRIPRIPPANPEPISTADSAPSGSVYPSLPTMDQSGPATSASGTFDRGLHHELDGHRGGYREGSANTTTSTGTSSGGDYHTAPSDPDRP